MEFMNPHVVSDEETIINSGNRIRKINSWKINSIKFWENLHLAFFSLSELLLFRLHFVYVDNVKEMKAVSSALDSQRAETGWGQFRRPDFNRDPVETSQLVGHNGQALALSSHCPYQVHGFGHSRLTTRNAGSWRKLSMLDHHRHFAEHISSCLFALNPVTYSTSICLYSCLVPVLFRVTPAMHLISLSDHTSFPPLVYWSSFPFLLLR